MKESRFQFSNPALNKLYFTINDGFRSDSETISIETNISTCVGPITNSPKESFATVEVTAKIGKEDITQPFFIEAVESAAFKWETEAYSQEDIEVLLRKNAAALLISYLRPIISNISSFSRYPTYYLPYVDLSSNKEE
jgi:preprotein translocase subunit SecB